MNDKALVS